jgi:hypothetical protein
MVIKSPSTVYMILYGPTLVPSAATRPSLIVAEQLGHGPLMRDRPRAALGGPLPVFAEGGRGDGGLVWVSVGNGLSWASSHGTKGIACYPHCPGTVPRGAPVLPVLIIDRTNSCAVLASPRPWTLYRPSPRSVSHGEALDPAASGWVTGLTSGQEAPERVHAFTHSPQHARRLTPGFRISLLTCVGTAGLEPATP